MSLTYSNSKIHPHKFALYLGCAGIVMMFAAWTSAYVVRHAAGNWLEFKLPNILYYNTATIILSSITLQFSYEAFKKRNENLYKSLLIVTFVLGILFIALQVVGWQQMMQMGVPLKKNPSGDFVYLFTGFHIAHLMAGLGILIVALVHAFGLPFKPTPRRQLRFELTLTYWHFVDLLWVYLLVFIYSQS